MSSIVRDEARGEERKTGHEATDAVELVLKKLQTERKTGQ